MAKGHLVISRSKGRTFGDSPVCDHDVQPTPNDPDWGRCVKCSAGGFPITDRAAYGDIDCKVCMDTGLVGFNVGGLFMDVRCTVCSPKEE